MRFNIKMKVILFFSIFTAGIHNAFSGAIDELSNSDKNKVKNGEQVAVYTNVGKVWPKSNNYKRLESTPEEAAAIFSDYELQSFYFPSLIKSKISKVIDKFTNEVDFSLRLPFDLGIENYTVKNKLSNYDNGDSYMVSWSLVRADTTKSTEGSARFEKLGTGTLLSFTNLIEPGRWGSGVSWVVEHAKKAAKDGVTNLVTQIEKEKTSQSELLQKQVELLRKTLQ